MRGISLLEIHLKCLVIYSFKPYQFDREDVIMSQNNRHPFRAMALMTAISSQLVGSILIGIFAGSGLIELLIPNRCF